MPTQVNRRADTHVLLRRALPLLLLLAFLAGTPAVFAASNIRQLYSGFNVSTKAIAGTAVDLKSRSVLYDLDRALPLPCTLASRFMLLLMVSESFDPDQTVSISSEVAAIERANPVPDQVELVTGQRVSVEFLTLRFLYYDSQGAIAALAELFNRDADQLARLMTSRAVNLELKATTFARGKDPGDSAYRFLPYSPLTSVGDLMRIQIAVLSNTQGLAYLSRGDAYLQVEAGGRRIVALRSPLSDLRVQSEARITAAYRVSDSQYAVDFAAGETADGIATACLIVSPFEPADDADILTLFNAIDRQYTTSVLTTKGDVVPSLSETAENGETFGLVYLDTVSYTHPRSDAFLKETISYQGKPPYRLPLQPDIPTGQVSFELFNGFKIAVNVGPDRAIFSDNSTYARFLLALQNNPNLTAILFGAVLLLLLALLFGIVRNVFRATYFYRLGGRRRK